MTQEITVIPEQQKPMILRPIVNPAELVIAEEEVGQLIIKALKSGVDYGFVPGSKKETLFKAGAERLQKAFGCHTDFEVVEKEIDHEKEIRWVKRYKSGTSIGLYRYVVKATIYAPGGLAVGSGLGSCSSLESKYVENPRDVENTIVKMAMKRAKVAATLDAFALSDRFTQDVEDLPIKNDDDEPWKAEPAPKPKAPFDPENRAHQDVIIGILTKRNIPSDKWDEIGAALKGRQSSDLDQVIKTVMGDKA